MGKTLVSYLELSKRKNLPIGQLARAGDVVECYLPKGSYCHQQPDGKALGKREAWPLHNGPASCPLTHSCGSIGKTGGGRQKRGTAAGLVHPRSLLAIAPVIS